MKRTRVKIWPPLNFSLYLVVIRWGSGGIDRFYFKSECDARNFVSTLFPDNRKT